MPQFTPLSEVTLHVGEAGLQVVLTAYQRARPEEFRIVSLNYPDGDPNTTPLSLNDDGEWLDYALRLSDITVDMAPQNPALHSPIPPSTGQFQISAKLSVEFRNFADAPAIFGFPVNLWFLAGPRLVPGTSTEMPYIALDLVKLRIQGIGPDQLLDYFEHILTLVVSQALRQIRIPVTFNVEEVLTLDILDLDVLDNSIQVYGAIYRPDGR